MQIRIDEIVLKQRIRNNLGDLSELAASMHKHGLLNPILVTPARELIAGHRRLESAKRLGWLTIDAIIVNDLDEVAKLEIEIDENLHRKALAPDEVADAYERLKRLQTPSLSMRIWRAIVGFFKRLFGKH